MSTNNEKIKIKVSEVASVLGWKYSTAASIVERKSPKLKYQTYLDCEKKLIEAKEQVINKISKN